MKIILKSVLYFFLVIGSLLILYLGADAIFSRISTHSDIENEKSIYAVYILSNGVHTDIVMPVKSEVIDWREIFSPEHIMNMDSSYQYIAIGWGDKGFYLNTPEWKDLSLKTALVAGLGIGETALHVTYYRQMYENENCYQTRINRQQYVKLIEYVKESLDTDTKGDPVLIKTDAQYGDSDAFYEANGAYSLFFSCNTWTNKALKTARMPSGVWTVLDKGILRHYRTK